MMFSILNKHHKVYSKAPSQIIMTDPYYADMKQHRRDADGVSVFFMLTIKYQKSVHAVDLSDWEPTSKE